MEILGECTYQRRMIKTEEKAKVVASASGGRIYSIPCRASCFAQDDFGEYDELHQDCKRKGLIKHIFHNLPGKKASAARNLINSSLQTEATTFAFSSLSSFYGTCTDLSWSALLTRMPCRWSTVIPCITDKRTLLIVIN